MFKLTQETIAIVTVGLTLAALVLTLAGFVISSTNDIRAEARADRAAWQAESARLQAEARADRATWQAESARLQAEARADREAFEKHVIRLTREQSQLSGIVEQMRTTSR